jgi:hypothetical protein
MQPHPGIRIHSIPAEGVGGLIFALGMAGVVLVAVPALRPLALVAVVGGVLLAPVLHQFRRWYR